MELIAWLGTKEVWIRQDLPLPLLAYIPPPADYLASLRTRMPPKTTNGMSTPNTYRGVPPPVLGRRPFIPWQHTGNPLSAKTTPEPAEGSVTAFKGKARTPLLYPPGLQEPSQHRLCSDHPENKNGRFKRMVKTTLKITLTAIQNKHPGQRAAIGTPSVRPKRGAPG